MRLVAKVHEILPIGKIIVEVASFDIQKIKNPDIKGAEYQQGEKSGFNNLRAYILCRDGHLCRYCKGKSGDKVLRVHHLESRLTGGDAPNNLITLCDSCHTKYHKGLIDLKGIKRGNCYKAESCMTAMKNQLIRDLRSRYSEVYVTFGYKTNFTRVQNHLDKDHHIDARCISGHPLAKPSDVYLMKKVRCHNRRIHKFKTLKGGRRKLNQAPYTVKGFRLFDKVKNDRKIGFIYGRRELGYFDIRTVYGEHINSSISYKKLELIEKRKNWLIDKM